MAKRYSFVGGVHPPQSKKSTEQSAIVQFPAPAKIVVPLSQHAGASAKPTIKRGDRVLVGQQIGEAVGFVSSSVHSPVAGTVLSIAPFSHPSGKQVMSIEIENDMTNESVSFQTSTRSWRDAAPQELIQVIQSAGIVGMGGAGIPAHVKLSPPSNKPVDVLIVNGVECEPFLTADHALMLECTEQLMEGILIVKKILGTKKTYIGIEENKPAVKKKIETFLADIKYKDLTLCILAQKYPQGGEKQLISAITEREVPSGGLPVDIGCVVQNVGTIIAIYNAVTAGIPLYERILTVTGTGIQSPQNFRVPIGTPIYHLIEQCGLSSRKVKKVLMGGSMMGLALSDVSVPVIKTTTGVILLDKDTPAQQYPCINCGHCVHVCPIHLIPSRIVKYVEKENYEGAQEWNLMDCIECGSCAYVCPAKINLVHWMKLGKYHILALHHTTEVKKHDR